jgi:phosphoserine phosphatase
MPEMSSHALVLTSPPAAPALDAGALVSARAELGAHKPLRERCLSDGEAWEALFTADPPEIAALRGRLAAAFASLPVDVNIVPADPAHRRKRLLVADMESTIIGEECLDELAAHVGLRERISAITARAMRGELDFEAALKERVGLLAGLPESVLDDLYTRLTVMPGAAPLVATMRAHGATCALVSGGFTYFTERIAARLGFDTQQANTLVITGGRLAGAVAEPVLGREAKLAALQRLARERSLDPADTMAVGDGANDADMVRAAGLGVAFRAKPVLVAAAAASVVHGDLTALLYLQGYTRAEFAN